MNSLLTPEPSIQDINANQHDYAAPGPSSVQPKVSTRSSERKRKSPPSTPKEERKRSIRPRLSATIDGIRILNSIPRFRRIGRHMEDFCIVSILP